MKCIVVRKETYIVYLIFVHIGNVSLGEGYRVGVERGATSRNEEDGRGGVQPALSSWDAFESFFLDSKLSSRQFPIYMMVHPLLKKAPPEDNPWSNHW